MNGTNAPTIATRSSERTFAASSASTPRSTRPPGTPHSAMARLESALSAATPTERRSGTGERAYSASDDSFKRVIETAAFHKFAQETSAFVEYRGPAELKQQLEKDYVFFGKGAERLKPKK